MHSRNASIAPTEDIQTMFLRAVKAWNPNTRAETSYYIGTDHRDMGIGQELQDVGFDIRNARYGQQGIEAIEVFPELDPSLRHGKYTKCFSFTFIHVWDWSEG